MTDHRKRVANAIRIAKEVHGKRLLQDQYPTHYMPNVGRQVMAGGGPAEAPSDGTTEVPAVYDQMGNVLVPAQRIVIDNYTPPQDEGYRQPLGERIKEGISKGFGEQRLGMREEDQRRYDPTGLVQNMFAAPADLFLRAPGAVIGGLSALGAGAYGALPGVDETQTNKLQRDLKVLGDVGMIEAGNVRPKAPTDVSSIPRFGEVLPPEASNALRISREVKERPTIDMEGSSRAPDTFLNAPEQPRPPISEGFAAPERPSLMQETYREPQLPAERPQAPPETPVAPVEAPGGNIDMSRRSFLRGMGATAASTIMPEGVVSALTETVKPAATAMDVSKATPILNEIFARPVPLNHPVVSQYTDPKRLSYEMDYSPYREGGGQSLSTWELADPEKSDQLYNAIATSHPQGIEGAKSVFGDVSKPFLEEARKELETKLGYAVTDEEFNNLTRSITSRQQAINGLRQNAYGASVEGLDLDALNNQVMEYAKLAGKLSGEAPPRSFNSVWENVFGRVTPEAIMEHQYGVPKEDIPRILDEPFAIESGLSPGIDPETTTIRDYYNKINEMAYDDWWNNANAADKRSLKQAWNQGVAEAKTGRPVDEPPQPVIEAPAAPAPKTLDDLRLAQAQAKQAFEDAKVDVRSDSKNPETRALVAQRQKEMMAATKELEKAESNREPRPGATSNAAPKVVEPEYVRPVSDFGLYSHAAEVAAKAKQAGKPEDLITWLKAQPGVKMEELEAAGAVTSSGKFNPEFAGGVKTMTPKELSDIFNEKTPDPKFIRRTEGDIEFHPRNVQELADIVIDNPVVWNDWFGFTLGDHSYFDKNGLRTAIESEEGQRLLKDVFNFTNGTISTRGGAQYGPSSYEGFTTPGGRNYEEIPIFLNLTPESPTKQYMISGGWGKGEIFKTREEAEQAFAKAGDQAREHFKDNPDMLHKTNMAIENAYIIEKDDPSYRSPNLTNFGHMSDISNNIAWIRKTEHDSPYGGVAYRMEESQSDLAQRGRDTGFNMNPEEVEIAKAKIKQIDSQLDDLNKKLDQYYSDSVEKNTYGTPEHWENEKKFLKEQKKLNSTQDRIRRHIANSEQGTSLPNFPYVKETQQWTDLTVKRALIDAANGGFDSVQFIKGDTNRRRYQEEGKDTGYHYDVNIPSSLSRILKTIDPSAKVETIKVEPKMDETTQDLVDHLKQEIEHYSGKIKELEKIIQEGKVPYGMEIRYDSRMDDYQIALDDNQYRLDNATAPLELWSVRMTPKLQRAIQKGLPKFKDGGAVNPGAIRGMTVDELQEALMG